jgi:hypothetical protein
MYHKLHCWKWSKVTHVLGMSSKVITIVTNQFETMIDQQDHWKQSGKSLNMMFIYSWVVLGVLQLE